MKRDYQIEATELTLTRLYAAVSLQASGCGQISGSRCSNSLQRRMPAAIQLTTATLADI